MLTWDANGTNPRGEAVGTKEAPKKHTENSVSRTSVVVVLLFQYHQWSQHEDWIPPKVHTGSLVQQASWD